MHRQLLAIVASSTLLSACASFDAAQSPAYSVAAARTMIAGETPGEVRVRMARMTPDERTTERDRVIGDYLTFEDASFREFRKNLSRNVKGTNVGLDTAILALTGVGSVWGSAAKYLSAGATGLGGVRATFAKELYFDKTLPSLVSMMASSRLQILADITKGQAKPETQYTIEQAFVDLGRYEDAGSLDTAIEQVAEAAAQQKAAAKLDYSKATKFCTVPDAVAQDRQTIMYRLEDLVDPARNSADQLAANRKHIQEAAIAAGISNASLATDEKGTTDELSQISDYLLSLCGAGPVASFKKSLEDKGVTFNG